MRNSYNIFLIIILFGLSTLSFGQATIFTDYFDGYTFGEKLVCQDSINWTTWGNAPCGSEDPMISNTQFSSVPNSVVITQGVDLVKELNNLTDGNYSIVFKFYLPDTKTGYFNVLQLFNGNNSEWGIDVYLNPGGAGVVNAGGNSAAAFTFTYNAWHTVEVKIDIAGTNDTAFFNLNGTNIHTWAWTAGASGSGGSKQIAAVDFFGELATNEMYIDNFQIWDNSLSDVEDYTNQPAEFELIQNYPNPFNPATRITYSLPQAGFVNLTVYNMLGEIAAVLVNGYRDAGTYNYTFNAADLTSGAYIYKLTAGNMVSTKKMLLIK